MVEQPIRNRLVGSSTLPVGSKLFYCLRINSHLPRSKITLYLFPWLIFPIYFLSIDTHKSCISFQWDHQKYPLPILPIRWAEEFQKQLAQFYLIDTLGRTFFSCFLDLWYHESVSSPELTTQPQGQYHSPSTSSVLAFSFILFSSGDQILHS